jgi:hypothetical protein
MFYDRLLAFSAISRLRDKRLENVNRRKPKTPSKQASKPPCVAADKNAAASESINFSDNIDSRSARRLQKPRRSGLESVIVPSMQSYLGNGYVYTYFLLSNRTQIVSPAIFTTQPAFRLLFSSNGCKKHNFIYLWFSNSQMQTK